MLTSQLERLIREGKALYKTYAIGGSGVGTIPVQTNEKIVITDFTWFPFCDVKPVNPIGTFTYFPVLEVNIKNIVPPMPGSFTPGDTIQGLAGLAVIGGATILAFVDPLLTIYVTGGDWSTVDNIIDNNSLATADIDGAFTTFPISPGDDIQNLSTLGTGTVLTNTPVATLNFSPGTLVIDNISGTFLSNTDIFNLTTGEFSAVENSAMSLDSNTDGIIQLAIASSIHTIRFRSQEVEAIFNFRDTPVPIIPLQTDDGDPPELLTTTLLGFSLPDPIQVHTYIQCPQTVQIDIWKFSPAENVFLQGNPPAKANEPDVPAGYRNAILNPPVIKITSGQGAIIYPLGTSRDPAATGLKVHNEFYDDIGNLTELNLPTNNQSFPLVNIGYVLINDARP